MTLSSHYLSPLELDYKISRELVECKLTGNFLFSEDTCLNNIYSVT